jgi:hypothetical protein
VRTNLCPLRAELCGVHILMAPAIACKYYVQQDLHILTGVSRRGCSPGVLSDAVALILKHVNRCC